MVYDYTSHVPYGQTNRQGRTHFEEINQSKQFPKLEFKTTGMNLQGSKYILAEEGTSTMVVLLLSESSDIGRKYLDSGGQIQFRGNSSLKSLPLCCCESTLASSTPWLCCDLTTGAIVKVMKYLKEKIRPPAELLAQPYPNTWNT